MITIDKDIVLIGLQADTKEAAIAKVVKRWRSMDMLNMNTMWRS